jgi:hypothetical protein
VCALAFIMCSKSNPLVVFALDLMSTYEGEPTIFGLLGQANLTQNDVLQFHPFTSRHMHLDSAFWAPFAFWEADCIFTK